LIAGKAKGILTLFVHSASGGYSTNMGNLKNLPLWFLPMGRVRKSVNNVN
jgi:hypothetical protein